MSNGKAKKTYDLQPTPSVVDTPSPGSESTFTGESAQSGEHGIFTKVLEAASVGCWIVEKDEGKEPRMYADATMLKLIGIDDASGMTPEEIHHAWADRVDPAHVDALEEGTRYMAEGQHAEIQYPWHHPDGRIIIVRCGGVRDFTYTKGLRITGIHQWVTAMKHVDRDLEAKRRQLTKSLTLADGLSREYHTVWTIDGKTHASALYRSTGVTTAAGTVEYGRNNPDYDTSMDWYVDNFVDEEDRDRVRKEVSWESIVKNTPDIGIYSVTYKRHPAPGKTDYHQMSFAKAVGEDGTMNFVFGYRDVDAIVRDQMEKEHAQQKRLEETLSMAQEANAKLTEQKSLLDYFVGSFSSAYSVNLAEGTFQVLHMEHKFANVIGENGNIHDGILKFIENHVHPDDRAMMLQLTDRDYIRTRLKSEASFSFTMREVFGSVEKTMRGVFIRGEDINHIAVGFTDITEQMETQKKLLLGAVPISASVLEKANIGLWAFELDEGLPPRMYHDETMLRLVGLDHQLPPEEAYHAWYDHVAKDCYQLVNDAVAKMMAGEHAEVQYPWHHPDGHTIIVRCGGIRNFSYTKGIRVEGTHQNVSAMLHYDDAEEKRRRATAAKDQILSEITQARYGYNVTIDLKTLKCSVIRGTGCDGAVDIFERCSDYGEVVREFDARVTDAEALRKTKELFSVDSIRKAVSAGKSGFIGSAVYPTESENPGEKGGVGWREVSLFIGTDAAGNQIANLLGRNITEEHEQADAAAQLLVAQSASEAKTKFLFSMSHDIRTPMNAIKGFTDIALKNLDDRERLVDSLKKIDSSSNLLLSLINSVLDMSRVESGKAKPEESVGDVMLSFANIKGTMQELAKTKGIALSFEFGNISDRYVFVDQGRCNRVFVNIISNAIKYSKPNGYVKVRCEQIGEKKNGKATYRYSFQDNGIGMSEEFLGHVFEEFARERNSTTSGIQGTGLGLALCKIFVELMGGTIECKSKQGEGTTFYVTLPFKVQDKTEFIDPSSGKIASADSADNAGAPRVEGAIAKLSFKGKRVLLVEDNELNREVATYMLEEQEFNVETAEDGSLAVKLVREKGLEYYDFILMDIQMPIMGGYEATRQIRADGYKRPIIALSANAFAEDKAASLAAGMNDHVAKPIKITELFTALTKFL